MALPNKMRLKGHRTFNYIHQNSTKYHGALMIFKVARSNPGILLSHNLKNTPDNLRVAIAISKKVSKKAVERNKIRRILQEWILTNIQKINNHRPYWLLVNLNVGVVHNNEFKFLEEFQHLIFESGLFK